MSMTDLPNLPGIRRNIAASNPKLYKEYQAHKESLNPSLSEERLNTPSVDEEESLSSYFENTSKLLEYSKTLSAFPKSGGSYNDVSGRYSLKSQMSDRLSKSRSLPYSNFDSVPNFVQNTSKVCRYLGYFTERNPENLQEPIRSRKVEISVYLEDYTIEIVEPKVKNSGLLQGKILKRHQILKPKQSGSKTGSISSAQSGPQYYTIDDFYSGAVVKIYDQDYHIIDCDNATRRLLEENEQDFGPSLPIPSTLYDPAASRGPPRKKIKAKSIAKTGFYQYDRKVLRFFGVWDSTKQFFGDELYVRMHYTLADDFIEVLPVNTRNSGRDKLAKFLKKTKIIKKSELNTEFDSMTLSRASSTGEMSTNGGDESEYQPIVPSRPYHWTDLYIGMKISVAALTITIIDADEFTREFFNSKCKPLSPAIIMPKPEYPQYEVTIPPHNGFGSEADSLQTCKSALQPGPPSKDGAKLERFQGMILRYIATMENPKPEDITRSFIIQVHLEDDTIQIREPPQRNSGHKGGIFLQRCSVEAHGGHGAAPLKADDIFLGGTVTILSHRFVVHDADEFTFRYMEDNNNIYKYSDLSRVLYSISDRQDVLSHLILTQPGLSSKFVGYDEIAAIFKRAGLNLVKQEIVTLLRVLDPKRSGNIKLTKLLKYIVDHK